MGMDSKSLEASIGGTTRFGGVRCDYLIFPFYLVFGYSYGLYSCLVGVHQSMGGTWLAVSGPMSPPGFRFGKNMAMTVVKWCNVAWHSQPWLVILHWMKVYTYMVVDRRRRGKRKMNGNKNNKNNSQTPECHHLCAWHAIYPLPYCFTHTTVTILVTCWSTKKGWQQTKGSRRDVGRGERGERGGDG